ncbi:MAG TPA: ScyD/ScyE family protein [Natronosporangium sp.]
MTGVIGGSGVATAFAGTGGHDGPGRYGHGGPRVQVIADGLDNPRGVEISGGRVLVAEAGRGGDGPCLPDPEGEGEVCLGATGAVTAVVPGKRHGHGPSQRRIITGLPSLAPPGGDEALGLHDIAVGRHGLLGVIGLGADPARRAELGPGGELMAQLVRFRRSATPIADLGAFEAAENPDGGEPDTNPYSLVRDRRWTVVTDAGGNDLLAVDRRGDITVLATFPETLVPAPEFLGLPPGTEIPMQAVPTGVTKGPDGAYYVGELTGFPFVPGAAKVWRVVPGEEPTIYAEGFTNIIDLAFDRSGRLYVLEIAKEGLLSGDPTGALIRVNRDGTRNELVPGALTLPGWLDIARDGTIFVSNNTVSAGDGELLRITQ